MVEACSGGASSTPALTTFLQPNALAAALGTPVPSGGRAARASVAFNDWTTYGYDNARDGFNPNTTAFNPRAIANLHLAWQISDRDFNTQTQPLLATNAGSHAGLLIVGGGLGKEYAFDAVSGAPVWSTALGEAAFQCGEGGPAYLGIAGTAAYDPLSGSLYVASNANDGTVDAPTQLYLNKLGVADGSLQARVNFTPHVLPGELNLTHTGVTLAKGLVYAATSSTCDISSWRGRVVAVDAGTMKLENTFYTAWRQGQSAKSAPLSGGGIWDWGGVSIDPGGNVWTAVGNVDNARGSVGPREPFAQTDDEFSGFGEHLLELAPGAASELQNNYPGFTFGGSSIDLDMSGTPVIAQPMGCDVSVAVQGKSGYLYLYDASNVGRGPASAYKFTTSSYDDPNLGNPGFSPLTGLFYASVASDVSGGVAPAPGMIAIRACGSSSRIVWSTPFGPDSQVALAPRSMPSITAGGVVFVGAPCDRDRRGGCTGRSATYGGALYALDAASGALLNSGEPLITTPGQLRMGAVVDGEWVYVFDNDGYLFGLTLDPKYPEIENASLQVRSRSQAIRWR
jgi:hypothetical protein